MTEPDLPQRPRGRLLRWPDALTRLLTALLLVTAAGQMFLVVPKYRRLLESLNVTPSAPARLAIALSHVGLAWFALGLLALGLARRKDRRGAAGVFATALVVAALLAAGYLALAGWVYWDVARIMGRIQ
jgi:hypothetical protein